MIGHDHPVLRAAQRFVMVIGVGALGAAVCATAILVAGPGGKETIRALRTGSEPSPGPGPLSTAESSAVALLNNAAAAAAALQYRGKKLFGSWTAGGGTSVLADVEHEPGRGTWVRVTSAGTDAAHPASDAARPGEAQLAEDGLDQPDAGAVGALTNSYSVRIGQAIQYIGRQATVVEVAPPQGDRVAGRFWLDRDTGILLRQELYDVAGRQIRVVAFLDLTIEPSAPPIRSSRCPVAPHLAASPPRAKRLTEPPLDAARLDELRRAGWIIPETLTGGLHLHRAREAVVGGDRAVQLTYTDGLFAASLFAQRGRLDTSTLHGFAPAEIGGVTVQARPGLYRQLAWSGGDTVYTLVTDAADADVVDMVTNLPHSPEDADLLSRVGRGIGRVGSWINPFE